MMTGLASIAAMQRSRSAAATAAPRVSSSYNPISDLKAGVWPSLETLREHGLLPQEVIAAWSQSDAGSHWHVDPAFDGRRIYQRFGLHCYSNGWSVFPESQSGDRKPVWYSWQERGHGGKLYRNEIRTKPSTQRDTLPHTLEVLTNAERSFGHNLAVTIGPASSNIRAVDIDCLDPELAEAVYRIAVEVLGDTPFVRIGRAPKMLLIYRVSTGEELRTTSFSFLHEGKPDGDNRIELLGNGRNFTVYGLHHGTGRSFDWSRGTMHPAIAPPSEAPMITERQWRQFVVKCNNLRPVSAIGSTTSSPVGADATFSEFQTVTAGEHNFWMPTPGTAKGEWQYDRSGSVWEGREAFLFKSAWQVAAANIGRIYAPGSVFDPEALVEAFAGYAVENVVADGKWAGNKVSNDAKSKLVAALSKWRRSLDRFASSGEYDPGVVPLNVPDDGRVMTRQHLPSAPRPVSGELDWLPPASSLGLGNKIKAWVSNKNTATRDADRAQRALVTDAVQQAIAHSRIADQIDGAATAFFAAIEAFDGDDLPPLHILKAPTGAGKTTRVAIRALGAYAKRHPRKPGEGPFIVALPTHANIDEALASAQRAGMIVPNPVDIEIKAVIADLAANGVKAEVLKGKGAAGCQRFAEVAALARAGIGAAGLCKAAVDVDNEVVARQKRHEGEKVEKVEELCEFRARGECKYWNQMDRIERADIVFVPHAYLTQHNPPAVVKTARAIVIDESVVYRILRQHRMPLAVLDGVRPVPRLTKAEKAAAADPELAADTIWRNREAVATTARDALLHGMCPANAIKAAGQQDLVDDAIKVCSRAHSQEHHLRPSMSAAWLQQIADDHQRAGYLIEEERFWRIVADRLEMLAADTAMGEVEERLQRVVMTDDSGSPVDAVRMSWRSEINWIDAPMLLLDASASPEIMSKCLGRKAEVHQIEAQAHLRTIAVIDRPFANRAFMPPSDADAAEVATAKKLTSDARSLVDKIARIYSHSRVLVGSTLSVREHLNNADEWTAYPNVDCLHYGDLRGRDFAKHHAAAISFGRSEMPIYVVDGFAAALTYDDPKPERPYDVMGDGHTVDGKPLFRKGAVRTIRLRSGDDITHMVPEMPGRWGRLLEHQWREEELRQFVGRLRPVYRDAAEPPVWICVSKSLPEDVIVDEVFTMDDLTSDGEFWRLLKTTGGVWGRSAFADNAGAMKILNGKNPVEFAKEHTDEAMRAHVEAKSTIVHRGGYTLGLPGWLDPADYVELGYAVTRPTDYPRDDRATAKRPDRIDLAAAEAAEMAQDVPIAPPPATKPPPTRQRYDVGDGWFVEFEDDEPTPDPVVEKAAPEILDLGDGWFVKFGDGL